MMFQIFNCKSDDNDDNFIEGIEQIRRMTLKNKDTNSSEVHEREQDIKLFNVHTSQVH